METSKIEHNYEFENDGILYLADLNSEKHKKLMDMIKE